MGFFRDGTHCLTKLFRKLIVPSYLELREFYSEGQCDSMNSRKCSVGPLRILKPIKSIILTIKQK